MCCIEQQLVPRLEESPSTGGVLSRAAPRPSPRPGRVSSVLTASGPRSTAGWDAQIMWPPPWTLTALRGVAASAARWSYQRQRTGLAARRFFAATRRFGGGSVHPKPPGLVSSLVLVLTCDGPRSGRWVLLETPPNLWRTHVPNCPAPCRRCPGRRRRPPPRPGQRLRALGLDRRTQGWPAAGGRRGRRPRRLRHRDVDDQHGRDPVRRLGRLSRASRRVPRRRLHGRRL